MVMNSPPSKRIIMITGASRGLGRALALRFGSQDTAVVINYHERKKEAEDVAKKIKKNGGEALTCQADVSISGEVERMVEETLTRWRRVDVLINNAGVTTEGLLLTLSDAAWDAVMETNLTGAWNCLHAVLPPMTQRRQGHIINISSLVGLQGARGATAYAASKGGLIGLTQEAARELGRFHIQVNAVLPGLLPTGMGRSLPHARRKEILRENALGRSSDLNEVVEFVHHLSLMKNVSGQVFNLDSRTP